MRVLFISVQRNLNIIGLRYIHECALEAGHDARFLFLNRFNDGGEPALEALRAFVGEFDPGIVGLSLTAHDSPPVRTLTGLLKQWFPALPVTWGGIYPTTEPEASLEFADYICRGEGEEMMVELLDALEHGRPVDDIANLGFKRDGEIRLNPLRPLVTDLDRFPILGPLPSMGYIQSKVAVEPVTLDHLKKYSLFRGTIYRILVSRGCPMHCHYCANSFLMRLYPDWGLRWRSVENVIRELEQAIKIHSAIKFVTFADDCVFSMKLDLMREFCREYKARVNRPFAAKATPAHISRERVDLMVDAGLAWANVGLQDGNDRVCKEVYGRPIPVAQFEKAAQILSEYPVAAYYDLILNNPFATREEDVQTAELLARIPRPFFPQALSLTFFQGTQIRERALKECPEQVVDPETKDMYRSVYRPEDELKIIASVLHRPLWRALLARFKKAPDSGLTRALVRMAGFYSRMVLFPLLFFRLLVRSQRNSLWTAVKLLPYVVDTRLISNFDLLHNTKDSTEE
ncbi:MAG TPA: radical SAM protein [Candidatus Hydrogenedentes bacterium]|nr:radical SAM protein [Candidatus Hydrogenedentota bacterium]